MDTKKVKVLLRAIELGSLSKAAEEFSYTPSAVMNILNKLEDEIGTKIVNRTYKGIELAENSEEIFEALRQLLDAEARVEKLVSDKKRGKDTISIASYASISKYVLPRIIKGFKAAHPHIDVNILVVGYLKEAYDKKLADVFFGEKDIVPETEWEEQICDRYIAVLPASYAGLNKKKSNIQREELYKEPFIMASDIHVEEYVDGAKICDMIKVESHDDSSILQMVKAGMGATILPSLSVENSDGVICMNVEPPLYRHLGLIYKKSDYQKKRTIREFIEYIRTLNL